MNGDSGNKILFISNGYGEDTIAASVILKLAGQIPKERILSFPVVGEGRAYREIGIKIAGPTKNMPSGGLIPGGWVKNLWMDFASGLGRLMLKQISRLKELKTEILAVVAVGDTYPVILGGLFTGKPVIFVGSAKSDFFYPYSSIERFIFKRFCNIVFPRDERTAESLRKDNINAKWVGNAMMDSLAYTGDRFGIPEDRKIIALLPGSRKVAYMDLPIILNAAEKVALKWEEPLGFVAPLADSISITDLKESAKEAGFVLTSNRAEEGLVGTLRRDEIEVLLLRRRFGDSIKLAYLVIGQAGTGNEQAVGLGKPVIAFDSGGIAKLGWYRLRQKGLLGDSLLIVKRNSAQIALQVLNLLKDKEKYEKMAKIGFERMGPPGGAEKMADYMFRFMSGEINKN